MTTNGLPPARPATFTTTAARPELLFQVLTRPAARRENVPPTCPRSASQVRLAMEPRRHRRVLYRLPELIAAMTAAKPCGASKAKRMFTPARQRAHGDCNSGGAGKWRRVRRLFVDVHVRIVATATSRAGPRSSCCRLAR